MIPQTDTSAPASHAASVPPHIDLPTPRAEFGVCLGQALRHRRSAREFDGRALPMQVMSELLWSAAGINRPISADRTVPSWRHACEMEIYVARQDGVWRYDPVWHRLLRYLADDVRPLTGLQDFVGIAPIDLIFVCNSEHLVESQPQEQHRVAAADTGFIGQNVYLFCASEGLACVFRGAIDYPRLERALQLSTTQFVTFAQTVGYPVV